MDKKVAVIGAGAAGLISLRHLLTKFEKVTCFEQSSFLGGTWRYNSEVKRSGGKPPCSIYRNLVTNLPTFQMQCPDTPFPTENSSFMHHSSVQSYLEAYAEKFDLKRLIRYQSSVERLSRSGGHWVIAISGPNGRYEDDFDAVFVTVGHFTYPRYIHVENLSKFGGRVFHSQQYDVPESFTGQKVLVIGRGNSAVDISVELSEYAETVFLSSSRQDVRPMPQRDNVQDVALVKGYDENSGQFYCTDGKTLETDAVIFATGYTYDMPFVDESVGLRIEDGLVSPLYKFMVHANFPTLFFIGMNQKISPFPVFHYQALFALSILSGHSKLPEDLVEVTRRMEEERLKNRKRRHYFYFDGSEDTAYMKELASLAGAPEPPQWFEPLRKATYELRSADPVNYKKYRIIFTDEKTFRFENHTGAVLKTISF